MIRMGRYDPLDKWDIVCRSRAGEEIDVGINRRGNRPLLPDWRDAAESGGNRYVGEYIRLKAASAAEDAVARLARQIGPEELSAKAKALITSSDASDLPAPVAERLREVFKHGALLELRWTDDPRELPDIEVLREAGKRRFHPLKSIKGKRNILSLFCGEYYGSIDVIHIYDTNPDHVTLVDYDERYMEGMRKIYPPEWTFICADYKEVLRDAKASGNTYDLITADAWRGMCSEVGLDMLPTIMELCTDTVVMHYCPEQYEELGARPDDFAAFSLAIQRRTGVAVEILEWAPTPMGNGRMAMRRR